LTKIYTKTGDKGTTSLFGGKRVLKCEETVEAYGSIDELTSFIGLAIAKVKNGADEQFLTDIQMGLYHIMSVLAGYDMDLLPLDTKITGFETYIDETEAALPKLNRFILPQGGEVASLFQILRTITRRSERQLVGFLQKNLDQYKEEYLDIMMKYLNRLSDLFFVMARKYDIHVEEEKVVFQGKPVRK